MDGVHVENKMYFDIHFMLYGQKKIALCNNVSFSIPFCRSFSGGLVSGAAASNKKNITLCSVGPNVHRQWRIWSCQEKSDSASQPLCSFTISSWLRYYDKEEITIPTRAIVKQEQYSPAANLSRVESHKTPPWLPTNDRFKAKPTIVCVHFWSYWPLGLYYF